MSEAAPAGYSSKSGQSSSIERMVPDNCRAKEPVKPVVPGGEPITLETAKVREESVQYFKCQYCFLTFFKFLSPERACAFHFTRMLYGGLLRAKLFFVVMRDRLKRAYTETHANHTATG